MDNLDYIDGYFSGDPLPEETSAFERRVTGDPEFAEQVAFYLAALQTAKTAGEDEKKVRFRELYYRENVGRETRRGEPGLAESGRVKRWWPYLAAAAIVAGLIFGGWLFFKPVSPERLADKYIGQHLQSLGVTMNSGVDSMQAGLRLFNEGSLRSAMQQFEKIIQSDTGNFKAKEYAGIVSLRLGEYDKAMAYFGELEKYSGLYANPAKFYEALALLKRSRSGDAGRAKSLLEQIVANDLEGKETAQEWLKKL